MDPGLDSLTRYMIGYFRSDSLVSLDDDIRSTLDGKRFSYRSTGILNRSQFTVSFDLIDQNRRDIRCNVSSQHSQSKLYRILEKMLESLRSLLGNRNICALTRERLVYWLNGDINMTLLASSHAPT